MTADTLAYRYALTVMVCGSIAICMGVVWLQIVSH